MGLAIPGRILGIVDECDQLARHDAQATRPPNDRVIEPVAGSSSQQALHSRLVDVGQEGGAQPVDAQRETDREADQSGLLSNACLRR